MDKRSWNIQRLSKLSNIDVTIFSNYCCDCIHHLLYVNVQWSSPTWSNAAVSLPSEKALCKWKIVEFPSHSSSVCALCINFTVSIADLLNQKQNFITLLCSFYTFIYKSSNLRGVTKTTFTKIMVTRQWKVITLLWSYLPDFWNTLYYFEVLKCKFFRFV